MYYLKKVEEKVSISPNMLGSSVEDAILRTLREKYERRIAKDVGVILSIDDPEVKTDGVIIPGDANVYYDVVFSALTFMPQINEVYECEVKELVEFGAFVSIGPLQGLVHISQIAQDKFSYDKKDKQLTSRASKKNLKKGDAALAKISTISMKSTTADTKIGLTMRTTGLGKHEWIKKDIAGDKKEKPKEKKDKGADK
ncbi:MAG: DNA-directed RNA polymerase [Candidatus Bilamarchaeaceae archaeon]